MPEKFASVPQLEARSTAHTVETFHRGKRVASYQLVGEHQWLWKENRALGRRLRAAKLKQRALIEDVDYQHHRGLDRKPLRTLASSAWVRQKLNIVFTGPTHNELPFGAPRYAPEGSRAKAC